MIDAKITLELLQNGIQKFIYAKTSEQMSRRILCTLTENGKVFNVSGYSFKVYHKVGDTVYYYPTLDFPDQVYQIPGTSTIAFILPANQTGEKVYELCVTKDNTIIYAPQFKVYYEGTIGPGVTPDPGTVTAYEPKITLSDVETTYDEDDYFVLSAEESPNDTYRLSVKDFVESLDGDMIAYDSSNSISDKIDDIDDVLDTKVDKVDGKGLSTNDYTDAEKTKLSGIEAGAEVNTVDSVNGQTGTVVLDGDDIAYDTNDSVNDKIDKKVDKVNGKGLSTNDFTDAYKSTLDNYSPYVLPIASQSTLGGVKIDDDTITIDENGVISATATGKATEIEDASNPGYAIDTPQNIYTRVMAGEVFAHNGSVLILSSYDMTAYAKIISFSYGKPNQNSQFYLLSVGGNAQTPKVITITEQGDFISPSQKSKLAGIAAGAEVNVQSDWNQSDNTKDDYIKNKPTIPSPYSLPAATTSALGGVKIDDETIKIDANGVITAEAESSVLTLTITSGESNYTKSELTDAVAAGKVVKYEGRVLQFNAESTYSISFYDLKTSTRDIGIVTVGTEANEYAASRNTYGTLATNNQTVDGVTDTIANHLTALTSQIANKIEEPSTAGTQGQVLTTDGNGGRSWKTPCGLPLDYQKVEYLKSTGTQYIDTGIIPDGNTSIELTAKADIYPSNPFFGSRNGYLDGDFTALVMEDGGENKVRCDYGTNSYMLRASVGDINDYKFNKNELYLNDSLQNTFPSVETMNNHSIYLFTLNNQGNPYSQVTSKTRIYKCTIWSGTNLVRRFVPCYHILTGETGMYDLVSNTFFTNAGTGTFLKGNDVN